MPVMGTQVTLVDAALPPPMPVHLFSMAGEVAATEDLCRRIPVRLRMLNQPYPARSGGAVSSRLSVAVSCWHSFCVRSYTARPTRHAA